MSAHTKGPYFVTPADEWTTPDGTVVQLGEYRVSAGSADVDSEDYYRIATVPNLNNSEQNKANADLIAEAFTVATETGLTPRQLAEQRAMLLEALKLVADLASQQWQEADGSLKGATDNQGRRLFFIGQDVMSEVRAAISAATGGEA